MPTGSSGVGGKGVHYPQIIELPLVKKAVKPPEGFDGADKAPCPRCKVDVWLTAAARQAMAEAKYVAMCPMCANAERVRQAKS